MGTTLTSPASFVAATKAKASEVNNKFTSIYNALTGGTHDPYVNAVINARTSNGSVGVTAGACYFSGYHIIDSNASYLLKDSTSRMVIFGDLTINAGGTLELTSGSECLIV